MDISKLSIAREKVIALGYTCTYEPEAIDKQIQEMQEFCEQHSFILDGVVSFVGCVLVRFEQRSGDVVKKRILEKGVDLLIVKGIKCLGGEMGDVFNTMSWLLKHGVHLYTLDGDLYMPDGKIVRGLPEGWERDIAILKALRS